MGRERQLAQGRGAERHPDRGDAASAARARGLRPALAFGGAVLAFAALAYGVRDGATFRWDRGPVDFFDEHYYDVGTVRGVTEAAVWTSIGLGGFLAAVLLAALLAERSYRRALFWALTVAGVLVLTRVLKALVERPEIGDFDTEYSFPSGNATASMAAAAAAVLLLRPSRLRRFVAAAGAVIVPLYGVALVLLLWHYPSDVIAGWAVGVGLVAALRLVLGDVSGPVPVRAFRAHPLRRSSFRPR